ncbi:MAG: preprotein translocase subunit SecA [Armatimonadetes bacterium]|nr:preprotein translocase subunit SecA [Armatimonadota bacterium]
MGFLKTIFDSNEREVKRLWPLVEKVNALEPQIQALGDEQLRGKTEEFRSRLRNGETPDDLLPEAFAVVREAAVRAIGQRHFDVQLMGGMVLHQGRIAEMKTGEGKTLVATLPLYLNALEGKGSHLVTVNDYLAKHGAQWMAPIYHLLGLTLGIVQGASAETGDLGASYIHDPDFENDDPKQQFLRPCEKREAYLADITYVNNSEIGFDYLRDNMAMSPDELSLRELNFAIVDEVDSILVDEARTPLIISGYVEESTDKYFKVDRVVSRLARQEEKDLGQAQKEVIKPGDYTVDEKARTAMLTETGTAKVEEALGLENLADDFEMMHHVNAALKARFVYKNDVDYVVREGQVIIVDEFTGRLMFGRRYSDGLHQAIEAKEGVKVEHESQTLATITYQNFFRLYTKLAGMTGTAKTEEEEFRKIYGLDVVCVPTNLPMIRKDYPDVIYKTEEAKFCGIVMELLYLYNRQQPVLVGTRSIEVSERLSGRLMSDKLQLLMATLILRAALEERKDIDKDTRGKHTQLINTKLDDLTLGRLKGLARDLNVDLDMTATENIAKGAALITDHMDYLNRHSKNGKDGPPEGSVERITDTTKLAEALQGGIPHNVLNAKYHEREAQIIAEAGRMGAVTIATNMAGRGVDIILGGKAEGTAAGKTPEAESVRQRGGLHILATERHESRRIDNQLRGRSGRQGDPGSSRFYVSLEDELWRLFGDKSNSFLLASWPEEMPVDAKLLSKMIERAQKKVEMNHFGIRKRTLEYDDVKNVQRDLIYKERRKILEGADLKESILESVEKIIDHEIDLYCSREISADEWDMHTLFETLDETMGVSLVIRPKDLEGRSREDLKEFLESAAYHIYEEREKMIDAQAEQPGYMRHLERWVALHTVNQKWIDHLASMDYLEEGIHLRGYAQQDPLVAYKKEAYAMFQELLYSIQHDIVAWMYHVQIQQNPVRRQAYHPIATGDGEGNGSAAPVRLKDKVGRNDPCPCGSGKKYKRCCLNKETV